MWRAAARSKTSSDRRRHRRRTPDGDKARQLVCAIFNYGMRPSTYALATNRSKSLDLTCEAVGG